MSEDQNDSLPQERLDGSAKVLIALVACIPLSWAWHGLIMLGVLPAGHQTASRPAITSSSVHREANDDDSTAEPIFSPEKMPVLRYGWRKGGFNTVYILEYITVKNKNPFAVNGVTVGCDQIAPDGTVFGTTVKPLYEHMAAGQKKTFRDISLGPLMNDRVATSSCQILGAVKAE